jgi:hypothetical protein
MTLEDAIDSLRHYADHGRPTGGFLEAVLSNDLFEALARADESSLTNLMTICQYVYNDMPAPCWGSPAKVAEWFARHQAARLALEQER